MARGVKLEVVVPPDLVRLIDSLLGSIYGQNRADVARFLMLTATQDHYAQLVAVAESRRLPARAVTP